MKKVLFFIFLNSFAFAQTYNLVDLYKLSFENSESYKVSKLKNEYSDDEVDKSLSAFYPKVNIETEFMKINEFPVIVDGVEQERRDDRKDTTFTVEQTIYDRSKYLDYKLKKNDFLQSEFDINKEHQELVFDVIRYYLESLLKAKQIELANQKLKRLETILLRAQVKLENGFISKADYLEAKLQRDELITQTIKRKLDYTVSKSFLEKLSGTNNIEIKKNINLAFFNTNHLKEYSDKIEENLDVQIQKLKVKKSDIKVSQSISDFEPTLLLKYEHVANDVPENENERTLSLFLKFNIFNGFYDTKNYQQSRIEKNIERLNFDKLLKDVDQNIKNKITNLNSYFEIIQSYPEVLESKKFILDGMQERFNIGTKSIIDLLDEENEYFEKLNIFTEYQYQFLLEYTELMRYTNYLNEDFLNEVDRLIYD
ncbi:TolC family protein [Aliarcobacter butzleri]|uniref:TolC family protein n=3 Tax=Aliarcobacter butzleri TaxID=28197 RepID=A0AAW7Q2G4_9BACT|nr:TolC family protein [Aliarcobacter butzleri]MDN5113364.1 TolC family protein [Aliarcobacter butzleri]MDY0193251.1 TolC family protein [Aliarcobacter butzleri]